MSSLPEYKRSLIDTCINYNTLRFGSFVLKSGRTSPYFFNAGSFSSARLLSILAHSYASTIASSPVLCPEGKPAFDIVFGPAYKGIPLASVTTTALFSLSEEFADVGYAFNRKEAKDHGEGGIIVGSEMRGKRVLIVDDVITAGTAIREAVGIIENAGGSVVGVVIALDRMERLSDQIEESAIMAVKRGTGMEVVPILTLEDLIMGVGEEKRGRIVEYRERYGAKEV